MILLHKYDISPENWQNSELTVETWIFLATVIFKMRFFSHKYVIILPKIDKLHKYLSKNMNFCCCSYFLKYNFLAQISYYFAKYRRNLRFFDTKLWLFLIKMRQILNKIWIRNSEFPFSAMKFKIGALMEKKNVCFGTVKKQHFCSSL